MAATNKQIQRWSDERTRTIAEKARAFLLSMEDDLAAIEDVYAALIDPACTWTDDRTDGPPSLLTKEDLLAVNTFCYDIRAAMRANAQLPVVLSACVQAVR